jgi:hypothetical protein
MSIQWIFDATHYDEAGKCFYKKVDDQWHVLCDDGDHFKSASLYNGETKESDLIGRPKQPQAWSGPEDGLPPVGTVCEYSLGDSNCWYVCEIKYVLRGGDGLVAECHLKPSIEQYLNTYQGTECLATFRAIKTEKQLAADKRESAIRELMDIAQVDCRVTAARLVDAGFKREVV